MKNKIELDEQVELDVVDIVYDDSQQPIEPNHTSDVVLTESENIAAAALNETFSDATTIILGEKLKATNNRVPYPRTLYTIYECDEDQSNDEAVVAPGKDLSIYSNKNR